LPIADLNSKQQEREGGMLLKLAIDIGCERGRTQKDTQKIPKLGILRSFSLE
jgi:hypothetical protein